MENELLKPLNVRELTFAEFSRINNTRCNQAFHKGAPPWPIENWALAIAGEAGELCNLVKKCLRGDFPVESKRQEILDELADVITYCDLAINYMGARTDEVVMDKFDRVSKRVKWELP